MPTSRASHDPLLPRAKPKKGSSFCCSSPGHDDEDEHDIEEVSVTESASSVPGSTTAVKTPKIISHLHKQAVSQLFSDDMFLQNDLLSEEHPDLEARMLESLNDKRIVTLNLKSDVYNLCFLTLFKKQADAKRLAVSFPSFYRSYGLGGLPRSCLVVQVLACLFVVTESLQEVSQLTFAAWMMLVPASIMHHRDYQLAFNDIANGWLYLEQQLVLKSHTPIAFAWLDEDRCRALKLILWLKVFVTVLTCASTAVVLYTQSTPSNIIKNYAAMSFIASEAQMAYQWFAMMDSRRQVGHESALWAGLGEYNMSVTIIVDMKTGSEHHLVNKCMGYYGVALVVVVACRCPIVYELLAKIFSA